MPFLCTVYCITNTLSRGNNPGDSGIHFPTWLKSNSLRIPLGFEVVDYRWPRRSDVEPRYGITQALTKLSWPKHVRELSAWLLDLGYCVAFRLFYFLFSLCFVQMYCRTGQYVRHVLSGLKDRWIFWRLSSPTSPPLATCHCHLTFAILAKPLSLTARFSIFA